MKDVLEEIARVAREEEALGQKVDALAGVALDGGNATQLERELGLDQEHVRAAYEPPSSDAKARVVSAIVGVLATNTEQAHWDRSSASQSAPRRWRRTVGFVAPVVALAAGIVFWLGTSRQTPEELARYDVELRGNIALTRSERARSDEPLQFMPGTTVSLVLRPQRPVVGDIAVYVYASDDTRGEAEPEPLEATLERAESGAVRVALALSNTLPEAGQLLVLVARDGSIGEQRRAQILLGSDSAGVGWQRFAWRFILKN